MSRQFTASDRSRVGAQTIASAAVQEGDRRDTECHQQTSMPSATLQSPPPAWRSPLLQELVLEIRNACQRISGLLRRPSLRDSIRVCPTCLGCGPEYVCHAQSLGCTLYIENLLRTGRRLSQLDVALIVRTWSEASSSVYCSRHFGTSRNLNTSQA